MVMVRFKVTLQLMTGAASSQIMCEPISTGARDKEARLRWLETRLRYALPFIPPAPLKARVRR